MQQYFDDRDQQKHNPRCEVDIWRACRDMIYEIAEVKNIN